MAGIKSGSRGPGFGGFLASLRQTGGYKFKEPRLGVAGKFPGPAPPDESQGAGVQRLMRQNEPGTLLIGQAVFDQRQIQVLVAAIELVADDGVAEVGKVEADLMFATGAGGYSQKRKGKIENGGWKRPTQCFSSSFSSIVPGFRGSRTRMIETLFHPIPGLGGRAIGADAILDGNPALLIPAERRIHQAVVGAHVAVNDGEVFLLDGAGFEKLAKFAGGLGIFGDENDAAGFAVEAVD